MKEQVLQIILLAHCNTKMKNKTNFIPLVLFFVLSGCMAKPKQPELTDKEKTYFNILAKQCHCNVHREIDPRPLSDNINTNDKRYYVLTFDSINVNIFRNIDSLKNVAEATSKTIQKDVLKGSFKYPYDSITISFSTKISQTTYKIETFTFAP